MRKQVWLASVDAPQPLPCFRLVCAKSFVFALRPSHQEIIQSTQRTKQRRSVKSSVVLNPSHEYRPSPMSDFFQGQITSMMQPPATDSLPDRFGCFIADRRCETDEHLSRRVLRRSRAKRVAQKVEALLGIAAPSVGILAVHNLGLVGVKLQMTLHKSLSASFKLRAWASFTQWQTMSSA